MIALLITGVGGPLGQAIVKASRASAIPCRILGTDRTALSTALDWVDRAHITPDAADKESYLREIRRLCEEEKIVLILPGSDSELMLLAEHAARLQTETGAAVVASSAELLGIALDKWRTGLFLQANHLQSPRAALAADKGAVERLIDEVGFPLIAKPRRGSGSRGLFRVRAIADVNYIRSLGEEMVFQEYLQPDDQEYTVGVYTQRDGRQAGAIAFRRELVAGNTYRAWVDQKPVVLREAEAVARALGARGPCNVQLRLTAGGPVTFEINARFSGTTAMRAHFGFNEVEMAIRDFGLAETVPPPVVRPGIALRHWEETYLDAAAQPGNSPPG